VLLLTDIVIRQSMSHLQ